MRSTIKFGMDEGRNPVIKINLDRNSDDLRDQMATHFFEEMQYSSNLCYVKWIHSSGGVSQIELIPISPGGLQDIVDNKDQASICPAQVEEMIRLNRPSWYDTPKEELMQQAEHLLMVLRDKSKDSIESDKYQGMIDEIFPIVGKE